MFSPTRPGRVRFSRAAFHSDFRAADLNVLAATRARRLRPQRTLRVHRLLSCHTDGSRVPDGARASELAARGRRSSNRIVPHWNNPCSSALLYGAGSEQVAAAAIAHVTGGGASTRH